MDGDTLADPVAVADHEPAVVTGEGQVLRLSPQDRTLVHHVVRPQCGEALERCVGANLATCANDHVAFDDGMGPDGHVVPQACARVDDGGGVDRHGAAS